MTDNIAITQGSGTTIAADNISSVFYQRIKLQLGDTDVKASDPLRAVISCSSSGANTIVAAVTSKVIRVLNYVLVCASAVTCQWQDGTPTNLSGAMSLDAKGGASAADPLSGLFQTAAGQALVLNLGGAFAVAGHLTYVTF